MTLLKLAMVILTNSTLTYHSSSQTYDLASAKNATQLHATLTSRLGNISMDTDPHPDCIRGSSTMSLLTSLDDVVQFQCMQQSHNCDHQCQLSRKSVLRQPAQPLTTRLQCGGLFPHINCVPITLDHPFPKHRKIPISSCQPQIQLLYAESSLVLPDEERASSRWKLGYCPGTLCRAYG